MPIKKLMQRFRRGKCCVYQFEKLFPYISPNVVRERGVEPSHFLLPASFLGFKASGGWYSNIWSYPLFLKASWSPGIVKDFFAWWYLTQPSIHPQWYVLQNHRGMVTLLVHIGGGMFFFTLGLNNPLSRTIGYLGKASKKRHELGTLSQQVG